MESLAKKYKGKVTFAAVSVFETTNAEVKDPVAKVESFLKQHGEHAGYSMGVDGEDNATSDAWIRTLRRTGVPTIFIIDQEGKVAWVDVNIDELEWALDQVLAKTWDRGKAGKVMERRDAIEDLALFKRDAKGAWPLIESFETEFPDRKDAVALCKGFALLQLDKSKIGAHLDEMLADPRTRYNNLRDIGFMTVGQDGLPKSTYASAAKAIQRYLDWKELPEVFNRSIMHARLADAYHRAGESAKAIASIEKAIAKATAEKEPEAQIRKLREALEKYKAG